MAASAAAYRSISPLPSLHGANANTGDEVRIAAIGLNNNKAREARWQISEVSCIIVYVYITGTLTGAEALLLLDYLSIQAGDSLHLSPSPQPDPAAPAPLSSLVELVRRSPQVLVYHTKCQNKPDCRLSSCFYFFFSPAKIFSPARRDGIPQ